MNALLLDAWVYGLPYSPLITLLDALVLLGVFAYRLGRRAGARRATTDAQIARARAASLENRLAFASARAAALAAEVLRLDAGIAAARSDLSVLADQLDLAELDGATDWAVEQS